MPLFIRQVRAAFEAHSVIVLRGQDVTNEGQFAFTCRFGEPEVVPVGTAGMGSNFITLSNFGSDGKVVAPDHRYALRNKANQLWHTDSSFKSVPALASILSARVVPAHGGETEFVSMRLAFEKFDPALQKRLENSFAWHDYSHSKGKIAPISRARPNARRSRRCAGAWLGKIRRMDERRFISRRTKNRRWHGPLCRRGWMTSSQRAATMPGTTYLHAWKNGDVVMWDNRATVHAAGPGHRMSRVSWCAPRFRLLQLTDWRACVRPRRPPNRESVRF